LYTLRSERLHINERISAARARVEAQGGRWGRPRRLSDAQITKLVQRRRAGRTLRQIAVAVKRPTSTIGDYLHR
jgi:DNA invertase Pin-like site-specific DNA recombinase